MCPGKNLERKVIDNLEKASAGPVMGNGQMRGIFKLLCLTNCFMMAVILSCL